MKKHLSLIMILSFYVGCETQIGTAIGTAIKNVVTGKAFRDSASDEIFENYRQKTIIASANATSNKGTSLLPDVTCAPAQETSPLSVKNVLEVSKIKDNLCSCKTWGTCDANSCSCDVLCPDDFNILNRPELTLSEVQDNSLSFTNTDSAFSRNDRSYTGYCWGHAVVTQRFNRLARFDGNKPKLYSAESQDHERIAYYKEIIQKINNNEPVDIPGYKNLQEFSRNPEVKTLLQESVKENWAANAMTAQGLSMVSSSDSQGAEYYNKLFDDINFRLNNFQSPVIVFNQLNKATRSHAVLVSGSGVERNGERYLCLRDNSFPASRTQDCQMKLSLKNDGTCYYQGWGKNIGKIVMAHSENGNTVEQIKNLHSNCLEGKNCSKEN